MERGVRLMLPSLWKFLTNNRARTPRSRRPARGSTFQLTMEGLEDRLVPSTASQLGSTLNVVASPGTSSTARTILLEVDQINPTKLDVKDNGALLGQFTIASINQVKVQ